MLQGIEVVNKVEIVETVNKYSSCVLITFIFILASLMIAPIFIHYKKKSLTIMMFNMFILNLVLFIVFSCIGNHEVPTGDYQYEVTIDKSVSMIEFHEKYELIKIDGDIYTIREK